MDNFHWYLITFCNQNQNYYPVILLCTQQRWKNNVLILNHSVINPKCLFSILLFCHEFEIYHPTTNQALWFWLLVGSVEKQKFLAILSSSFYSFPHVEHMANGHVMISRKLWLKNWFHIIWFEWHFPFINGLYSEWCYITNTLDIFTTMCTLNYLLLCWWFAVLSMLASYCCFSSVFNHFIHDFRYNYFACTHVVLL